VALSPVVTPVRLTPPPVSPASSEAGGAGEQQGAEELVAASPSSSGSPELRARLAALKDFSPTAEEEEAEHDRTRPAERTARRGEAAGADSERTGEDSEAAGAQQSGRRY